MFNFLLQSAALAGAKNTISAVLIGATTLLNPGTAVKPTSFDASVYVSANGKIKVAVQKSVPGSVWVILADSRNRMLSQTMLGKTDMKSSLQFDVSDLPDGAYILTIKSQEGRIVKQVNLETPKSVRTIEMQ